MIPEILAGIGLGKLSEDVMKEKEEERNLLINAEDQVDWCPEMDYPGKDEE